MSCRRIRIRASAICASAALALVASAGPAACAPGSPPPAGGAKPGMRKEFVGKVESVDPKAKTFVIRCNSKKTPTVTFRQDGKTVWAGLPHAGVTPKVGEMLMVVGFSESGGTYRADTIRVPNSKPSVAGPSTLKASP